MRIRLSIAAGPLALLFVIFPASALDPNTRISQYAHTAWRMQDGAFNGTPHVVAQTTDGYFWIGTDAGLVKFDGVRFAPWEPPAGQKLASSTIFSLFPGRDGALWIGTSEGLERWKDGNLVALSNAHGRINAIVEDHAGTIWAARSRNREPTGGLCRVSGDQLQCVGNSWEPPLRFAGPLAEDMQGSLWIGSDQQLLRLKSGAKDSYFREQLKSFEGLSGVEALAADADGTLWVGFARKGLGLQHLVNAVPQPIVLNGVAAPNLNVSTLFMDRDNSLWIGTFNDGVYRLRGATVDHFRNEDGLSSNVVEDVRQDREGGIWIVTTRGIDYFRDTQIVSLSVHEGLTSDEVASVLASRDGAIWIGNHGAVDLLRANKISAIGTTNGLPGERITSLAEDYVGRIWMGVDSLLAVYERGQFRKISRPDSAPLGAVIAMAEDNDRNMWVSVIGKNRRLFRIQDLQVREEFTEAQIPRARLLAANPAGGIWLGLNNGNLARYRSGKLDIFPLNLAPADSRLNGLFVDADSSAWVATLKGMFRWKDGSLKALTSKNGLPCDEMFTAVRDDQKTLWLYAKCGLIAIPDLELARWLRQPDSLVRVRLLDVLDGAQPGLTTFQPSVSKSSDGRLWFANDTLLQVIDPRHLHENRIRPPVHIEQVVADRKNYSPQENLRLPEHTRDVEIDYTALSFTVPQKVRFRYRLDGHDADWQEPGSRRQAFYSDLPPGQYRFRVIACNNDGLWNETGAVFNFGIAPAFYQKLWVRVVFVAFCIAALGILYRIRVRQIAAAMNARFNERLAERTRLARDFHDTLLQTIQGSKLVADDALEQQADPIRMRDALERLSGWLEQAMDEGRSALNSLRSSTTQGNDLAEAFQRAGEECRLQRPIEFSLAVEGSGREMHPIVRDEVYRIGYEAIRNASAHSQASRLNVDLSYVENLTVRVRDNGTGIDPVVAKKGKSGHFGLIGMYERAARIGGKLTVTSSPAGGTEVELIVPRQIVFQESNPIRRSRFKWIKSLF